MRFKNLLSIFGNTAMSERKAIAKLKKLEGKYVGVCARHQGDFYLWLTMDRSRSHLKRLLAEAKDCCLTD